MKKRGTEHLAQTSFKQKRIHHLCLSSNIYDLIIQLHKLSSNSHVHAIYFYFLHGILRPRHVTILGTKFYPQQTHQLVHRQVVQEYIAMHPSSQFYPIRTWWI